MHTNMQVPSNEHDTAKATRLGAVFDSELNTWCLLPGIDASVFRDEGWIRGGETPAKRERSDSCERSSETEETGACVYVYVCVRTRAGHEI